MLKNMSCIGDLVGRKRSIFPVFQWEWNHIAMLTETASSSQETAEPVEKEQ